MWSQLFYCRSFILFLLCLWFCFVDFHTFSETLVRFYALFNKFREKKEGGHRGLRWGSELRQTWFRHQTGPKKLYTATIILTSFQLLLFTCLQHLLLTCLQHFLIQTSVYSIPPFTCHGPVRPVSVGERDQTWIVAWCWIFFSLFMPSAVKYHFISSLPTW